jgi:hypothetical protein
MKFYQDFLDCNADFPYRRSPYFLDKFLIILLDLANAYHYRARVNQCRGEFARAIPDFTMAIQLDSAK